MKNAFEKFGCRLFLPLNGMSILRKERRTLSLAGASWCSARVVTLHVTSHWEKHILPVRRQALWVFLPTGIHSPERERKRETEHRDPLLREHPLKTSTWPMCACICEQKCLCGCVRVCVYVMSARFHVYMCVLQDAEPPPSNGPQRPAGACVLLWDGVKNNTPPVPLSLVLLPNTKHILCKENLKYKVTSF